MSTATPTNSDELDDSDKKLRTARLNLDRGESQVDRLLHQLQGLQEIVRGFCIATGPYSSFCVCAGVLVLGGSDLMEDEQNKGGEEIGEDV